MFPVDESMVPTYVEIGLILGYFEFCVLFESMGDVRVRVRVRIYEMCDDWLTFHLAVTRGNDRGIDSIIQGRRNTQWAPQVPKQHKASDLQRHRLMDPPSAR